MKKNVSNYKGIAHGLTLKILSILAKIMFLLLVAPMLKEGEFARYVFLSTCALLIARIFSMGVNNQIPVEVKGQEIRARKFYTFIRLFLTTSIALFILAGLLQLTWINLVLLSCSLLASAYIEGVLKSLSPEQNEKLINFPWILLLLGCMIFNVEEADRVLILYSGSILMVSTFMAFRIGVWSINKEHDRWQSKKEIIEFYKKGAIKSMSDVLLLANSRSLVLWPKWLGLGGLTDQLTLALTIAEAISTLPMVIINRNYTQYCSSAIHRIKSHIFGIRIIAFMLFCSSLAYFLVKLYTYLLNSGWSLPPYVKMVDGYSLAIAFVLYAGICAFYEIRNYRWAYGFSESLILKILLFSFFIQAVIVGMLGVKLSYLMIPFTITTIIAFYLIFGLYKNR